MPNPTIAAINELQDSANYADYLGQYFENEGQDATAAKFFQREKRLSAEIAILWDALFDQWSAQATSLTQQIKDNNEDLTTSITRIQGAAATANDVVQALGILDQILTLAAKFMI